MADSNPDSVEWELEAVGPIELDADADVGALPTRGRAWVRDGCVTVPTVGGFGRGIIRGDFTFAGGGGGLATAWLRMRTGVLLPLFLSLMLCTSASASPLLTAPGILLGVSVDRSRAFPWRHGVLVLESFLVLVPSTFGWGRRSGA